MSGASNSRPKLDLLLAFALILLVIYHVAGEPRVRFDRERIDVWALPGQLQVTGLYHYQNQSRLPAWITLGVPFPVDANHAAPTTFSLSESDSKGLPGAPIRPAVHNRRFRLLFRPGEEKWVRLDYVQQARSSDATYILLTTRAWKRPLDRGEYVLHLAPGSALLHSNYSVSASSAPNTYAFARHDFYPDHDWTFHWGVAHAPSRVPIDERPGEQP